MAYNYGNQALENMLPLFASMANGSGTMGNHPNFINQLAAAITTAVGAGAIGGINATPPVTTTATVAGTKRDCTPEPPPAPKFSSASPPKMKPNQGSTAPMDLEMDSEIDMPIATTSSAMATTSGPAASKVFEKIPLNIHDPNIFLNGFMPPTSMNAAAASGYMFFPTATTTTDPTAMMAAMQQMHQSYAAAAGYSLPDSTGAVDAATAQQLAAASGSEPYATTTMKEVIKTKNSILFPPNPNAPPPTIRERPPGCRTVFVGGLPENISEEIIREIFESCGEITTLRMSKKNFCHIRYRHEASIDHAIYLSGYRVRISILNEPANFGRLHVDYAQARDDQYDYECKQRQLQREQRHRDRVSIDRIRSLSPPPMPHYTDHEASLVAESLRCNDTFIKAIQTISVWLERGDCTKRNANIFYSMIQSTHAHVRRLYTDKQQLEEDLRKARESYRKQMLSMSTQFTQIEKVFNAASHKKVWDHFTKAQRKNIDQWKKLATELRSVHIEDDEMEMSDDDRDYPQSVKRSRFDSDSLKEENDSLRCQLEALRNEMSLVRTDVKYDSEFREKQIKVLQETIRNMQTQLLQMKMRELKDAKTVEQLERRLKQAGVKQLLLKTKIKETSERLKDKETLSSRNSEASEIQIDECGGGTEVNEEVDEVRDKQQLNNKEKEQKDKRFEANNIQIIDIDIYKSDDDVKIIEENQSDVEINEIEIDAKGKKELAKELMFTRLKYTKSTEDIKRPIDEENNLKDTELKTLGHFEAKIIALAAAYLVVHPFGVTTESICTYLCNVIKSLEIQTNSLEVILKTYTNLFKAEISTNTPGVALKWKFCGFLDNNNFEKLV